MEASREFERSIDALDGLFRFVGERLPDGLAERVVLHINLAVEEIFTNMVRHNEPGGERIAVAVQVTGKGIRVRLTDFDVAPFDPDSVPPVDVSLPLAQRRAGGLGLHLVKSIVDRLTYEYEDRVMRVTFIKSLEEARFEIRAAGENRLVLIGRFDAAQTETAMEVLYGLERSTVLDCSRLKYTSSAALGVLFEAQRRLNDIDHTLTLVNLNAHLRELFSIGGFDQILRIE